MGTCQAVRDENVYSLFDETPVALREFIESGEHMSLEYSSDRQFEFVEHGTQTFRTATIGTSWVG